MNNKWNQFKVTESKKFGFDVPVFTPSIFREFRGEIFTTYHSEEHPVMNHIHYNKEELSIHGRFSRSYKGVLRGLHYDNKTWKLVQALVGEIYLVVLDARPTSPTYGDWESYLITERTREQVLVPPGFANGHYALTDCIFHYNMFYKDGYVDSVDHGVIKWNDPEFQIEWPTDNPILQSKDK
jgi:dTDP-4-dehydrorhamnose 3,5-epimerase